MKPEKQSWHEYLTESRANLSEAVNAISEVNDARLKIVNDKINELKGVYDPLFAKMRGPVKYRDTPFHIIKEVLPYFPGRDKYGEYGFRAQCLITGNTSFWIKVDEFDKFNINPEWQKSGGPFLNKLKIDSEVYKIYRHYYDMLRDLLNYRFIQQSRLNMTYYRSLNTDWFIRYDEYLKSEEWHETRTMVRLHDSNMCTNCQADTNLQVHHMTYVNVGQEELDDLITLCESCHKEIHSMQYSDRIERENLLREYRYYLNKD